MVHTCRFYKKEFFKNNFFFSKNIHTDQTFGYTHTHTHTHTSWISTQISYKWKKGSINKIELENYIHN